MRSEEGSFISQEADSWSITSILEGNRPINVLFPTATQTAEQRNSKKSNLETQE